MLHTHGGVLGSRRLLPRAVPEVMYINITTPTAAVTRTVRTCCDM